MFRSRKAGLMATGLASVALLASACGGSSTPQVATLSAAKTTTTTAITAATRQADALKFSQCMRKNGVADFPDPGSGGRIDIGGGSSSDLNRNNPAFQTASKACSQYRPKPSSAELQALQQNALKFSQCMRKNGVADFPDPNFSSSGGGFGFRASGSQIDRNSPQFQSAIKACGSLFGGRRGGFRTGGVSSGSGSSGGPSGA